MSAGTSGISARLSQQYAAANSRVKLASSQLSTGRTDPSTVRGRAVARDAALADTSRTIKGAMVTAVQLTRASILAKALAAAKEIGRKQAEKIEIVTQQLARVNSGKAIEAGAVAEYDKLVDGQYERSLDVKDESGKRLVGAATAAGRTRSLVLDGEVKTYDLQQFRIDVVTANTQAVRNKLQTAADAKTNTAAQAAAIAAGLRVAANGIVGGGSLHGVVMGVVPVDGAVTIDVVALMTRKYVERGGADNPADAEAAGKAIGRYANLFISALGGAAEHTTGDGALAAVAPAAAYNDADVTVVGNYNAVQGVVLALNDAFMAKRANTSIKGAVSDLEIWGVGEAAAAGEAGGNLNRSSLTRADVNAHLHRQLAVHDGVVALVDDGNDIVNNVLSFAVGNDAAKLQYILEADKEIAVMMADKANKLESHNQRLIKMADALADEEIGQGELYDAFTLANGLELNDELARNSRMLLASALMAGRAQRNEDEAMRAVMGG